MKTMKLNLLEKNEMNEVRGGRSATDKPMYCNCECWCFWDSDMNQWDGVNTRAFVNHVSVVKTGIK